MKPASLAFVCLSLAIASLALCAPARADGIQPKWLLDCTVRVVHEVQELDAAGVPCTLHQSGSGTVIQRTESAFFVLTCAHNLENQGKHAKGKCFVVLSSGVKLSATCVLADGTHDLAILRVTSKRKVSVALLATSEDYRSGTKVIKCGYPRTLRAVGTGKILDVASTISRGGKDIPVALSDIDSTHGDSGCGVFRVRDKTLVGVLYGGGYDARRQARFSSMTRLREIREFLLRAEEKDAEFKIKGE